MPFPTAEIKLNREFFTMPKKKKVHAIFTPAAHTLLTYLELHKDLYIKEF